MKLHLFIEYVRRTFSFFGMSLAWNFNGPNHWYLALRFRFMFWAFYVILDFTDWMIESIEKEIEG